MGEPSSAGKGLRSVTDASAVDRTEERTRAGVTLNARLKMVAARFARRLDQSKDFASYALATVASPDSPNVLRDMMRFPLSYHADGFDAFEIKTPDSSTRARVRIEVGEGSGFSGDDVINGYVEGDFVGIIDAELQQDDEVLFHGVAMINDTPFAVNLRPRQGDNAPDISIDPRHLERFDEPAQQVIEELYPPSLRASLSKSDLPSVA